MSLSPQDMGISLDHEHTAKPGCLCYGVTNGGVRTRDPRRDFALFGAHTGRFGHDDSAIEFHTNRLVLHSNRTIRQSLEDQGKQNYMSATEI